MAGNKFRYALILLFCGYIGLFGALYILLPKEDFSEKEKRVLSEAPQPSVEAILDGSFEADLETWMSDHVPGRDLLVGLNARYELISGRNGLGGVICSDGRLIASAEALNAQSVASKCARINTFAQTVGLPVDVMLAPTSGHMHAQALPLHAPYPDAELVRLLRGELDASVGLLWPEEHFRQLGGVQLYYNTDHHLTSRGAYELCGLYARSAGVQMPPADNYDVETVDGFYGSMYAKAGLWSTAPDQLELWRSRSLGPVTVTFDDREAADCLFFEEHLTRMDKYPVFLDGNHGLVTIDTGRTGGENLLLIRDSFGHCFAPFAADVFDRVALVDLRYYRKPVSELVREMEIDRVLVLYGVDTFLTDTNFVWLK